jgi:hypothetical protein
MSYIPLEPGIYLMKATMSYQAEVSEAYWPVTSILYHISKRALYVNLATLVVQSSTQ